MLGRTPPSLLVCRNGQKRGQKTILSSTKSDDLGAFLLTSNFAKNDPLKKLSLTDVWFGCVRKLMIF